MEEKFVEVKYTEDEQKLNNLFRTDCDKYMEFKAQLVKGGYCVEYREVEAGYRSHLIFKTVPEVIECRVIRGGEINRFRSHGYLTDEEREFLFKQLKGE